MKKIKLVAFLFVFIFFLSCRKDHGNNNGNGNNGNGNSGGGNNGNNDTNCIISTISQLNSGLSSESSLSAFYNNSYNVTKLVIYDSVNKVKNFEADFNYISSDSIIIDQYQYLILDTQSRVIRFKTKSDWSDLENSDDYLYEYLYNDQGFLSIRNLYINNSQSPELSTAYNYTNNLMTSCIQTAFTSGNLKVLESTLTYNTSITIKNWIYTLPDATQEYMYLTALNFGNRSSNPLKQVVTKIYDPTSGILLDTWTTNYTNYIVDGHGHLLSGEADGDLQEGIASFYGKTNFYYQCH